MDVLEHVPKRDDIEHSKLIARAREWLSQEGITGSSDSGEAAPGDTTIIPRPAAFDTPVPPPSQHREQPRQFRSVADEAADIIRRHWEKVKAQRDQG